MPDVDSPYIFGLPDNIDRSLQRALSSAVISQLRQLSVTDIETNKYDRERWRSQVIFVFVKSSKNICNYNYFVCYSWDLF
jgi:hypothetical protein